MRGHRPLPPGEPAYPLMRADDEPRNLTPAARRIWRRLFGELSGSGVLCATDREALWQLCMDQSLLEEALYGLQLEQRRMAASITSMGREVHPGQTMLALQRTPGGRGAMKVIGDLAARV